MRVFFLNKVKIWITLNEPYVTAWGGYGSGTMAPGIYDPVVGVYHVAHNLIRSHAAAWHTYDRDFRATQMGISPNIFYFISL